MRESRVSLPHEVSVMMADNFTFQAVLEICLPVT